MNIEFKVGTANSNGYEVGRLRSKKTDSNLIGIAK